MYYLFVCLWRSIYFDFTFINLKQLTTMTKQEIDNLINQGEPLERVFGIRQISHNLGTQRITSKQFDAALKRFEGKLDFKHIGSGITVHRYTLKKILL